MLKINLFVFNPIPPYIDFRFGFYSHVHGFFLLISVLSVSIFLQVQLAGVRWLTWAVLRVW
ncbi:hypothetical protein ES332_A02G034500v1 [Gossypium tomentosum]|uniref:Uncharacterized protein n=1 Tax=Gossypium tomentosum TaxID=34277 RepID=A0A5D2RCI7_GOSTO|nr:hypothetical protein ES332_A02G034500v1 [Gossypium tomentosum]